MTLQRSLASASPASACVLVTFVPIASFVDTSRPPNPKLHTKTRRSAPGLEGGIRRRVTPSVTHTLFVYLFRQRNADCALTTVVTGRNLSPRTPTSHWMFVKALQIDKGRRHRASLTLKRRPASWSESATISLKRMVSRAWIGPAPIQGFHARIASFPRYGRSTRPAARCGLSR